jgi:predicted PurR-regulated permease PerM
VWLTAVLLVLLAVYLLRGVLAPFLAGIGVAYFLDPLTDKVEARVRSRTLATAVVIIGFFGLVGVGVFFLFPLLQHQVTGLAARMPDVFDALRAAAEPLFERLQAGLTADQQRSLEGAIQQYAGSLAERLGDLVGGVWSGGLAVFGMLGLLLISPLVAFYLLRDWDRLIARLDALLPRDSASTIREQARAVDRTLAAFVRGQALVCMLLAAYYGTGLALTGLQSGLLVGILTGLAAFIPYLGVLAGLIVSVAIAVVQFDSWIPVASVVAVIAVGHALEGGFLTPKLLGGRVGLHPVWVLFALMVGGSLFGFTGVLLAVPSAAVIGVLVRFGTTRYLDSRLYQGSGTNT